MSITKLRKRISLVAVTALTAGMFSVVSAPASNAAIDGLTVLASGQNTPPCAAGSPTASSTPRYMPVGGKQALTWTGSASASASVTITGPAKFLSAGSGHTLDDTKTANMAAAAAAADTAGPMVIEFTGAGPVQVSTDDDTTTNTLYFIAVATCASGWSATQSKAQLNTAAGDSATSNIDVVAATSVAYNASGQYSYLDIILNDGYGVALTTTLTAKIATVTGGCTINWDATAVSGTSTAIDAAAASDATEDLVIIGDNTPRTCTVTVTYGSDTVATKTVKFLGEVASLTVDTANSGKIWGYGVDGDAATDLTGANADKIIYVAKDSAGNIVNLSSAPTLSDATNGASQCTADNGYYTASTAVTNGLASLDVICSSTTVRGPAQYQIKVTRASDGVSVKSNVVTVEVNKTVHTFKASWDKATYNIGEIMILTIEGLDSAGRKAYDGETVGSDIAINVSGADRLSNAPATGDRFSNGVVKYQYTAKTTAAQYAWNALISNDSGQEMVTGTYTIKDPNSGTSNADVLKAIVSLIASINKQIQALQKLILRR
jgi:hypothetical protein